jgi:flavorubredoxin
MATVTEIASGIFRICAYHKVGNFQFSSFLVKDEEPLLYHTNLRGFFDEVKNGVARILDPTKLRWIGFSHFEADECGSLNEWLALAPRAEPFCSFVGARTSIGDFAARPPRVLAADDRIDTGDHHFRVIETKHVPHGWDASLLFEETTRTLFCSDLFGHNGDVEPLITSDIVGRCDAYVTKQQEGPMSQSVPFTRHTNRILGSLAALNPRTLACMHGSSFSGDGAAALRDLAALFERIDAQT